MKVKERDFEAKVCCRVCCKTFTLLVGKEDLAMYNSPNRPYIQDIFPYLTPAERELLISGLCPDCWDSMFSDFDDEDEDYDDDDEDCFCE